MYGRYWTYHLVWVHQWSAYHVLPETPPIVYLKCGTCNSQLIPTRFVWGYQWCLVLTESKPAWPKLFGIAQCNSTSAKSGPCFWIVWRKSYRKHIVLVSRLPSGVIECLGRYQSVYVVRDSAEHRLGKQRGVRIRPWIRVLNSITYSSSFIKTRTQKMYITRLYDTE